MTPIPTDVTDIGKELYDGVAPLAEDDEANGWDLLRYCDALIGQAQPIRDQASDRSATELGWSIMMDVNNCPAYGLDWLSQFAGVDLTKLHRGVNVLSRNEFVNPNFEYDTVGLAPYGYSQNSNAGVTEKIFTTTNVGPIKGTKSMSVKGVKANNETVEAIGWITSGVAANQIPVQHGEFLTLQMRVNILKKASGGFNLSVVWYKADNVTQVSTSVVTKLTQGEEGIKLITQTFSPPEHAAFAHVSLQGISSVPLQEVAFYTDELIALITETAPSLPIEYVDGDEPGCSWVGTPGQSNSIKATEQTEEQFNESKRSRIKELPASRRGSPGAIVKAAQQYLIGDKTVVMQERPAGNAWRLVVITYTAETPNEKLVKEAIEEQLPAGIVLEYSVIPGADWLLVRTEYTTWQQVKEAFVTWGGVRLNQPGT
jgi:hypothetical protein